MRETLRNYFSTRRRLNHRRAVRFLRTLCLILPAVFCVSYFCHAAAPGVNGETAVQNSPAANTPAASQVPPPSTSPKLSQAELEKLLMPIALYPDPLLATVLPASVFPLEIVQAARFLQDTNNASKIDDQSWDETVKAVARIPEALKKLNDDLPWTIQLGEVFLAQDKDVMDTIQALRLKAQTAGTLQNSEQQSIVVTNMVVEKTVEQQVVVVTNTVVQIQPSNPEVVYVPSYPPTVYAPPPGYVYNPVAPLITFTAGVAMGAIIANNCDWNHGGCHWGNSWGGNNVNVERNTSINVSGNVNNVRGGDRVNAYQGGQKWQPDQTRLRSSGSTAATGRTMESRGWSSGATPQTAARANAQGNSAGRTQGSGTSARAAGTASRPATSGSTANRPAASSAAANRPAASASSAPRAAGNSSINNGNLSSRPAASSASAGSPRSSAFSSGGNSQSYSQRGAASRGTGSSGAGAGGGRSGGGRAGGGGRR